MVDLLCRDEEKKVLESLYSSQDPEFLAIYGRRRVGKTFLIRQFFKVKEAQESAIFFNVTGTKKAPLQTQISHFTQQISEVFFKGITLEAGNTWDKSLELLTRTIREHAPQDKKIILFFDELPWMATRNSRLLGALDYYWNQHWSNDPRIKLIICGSSTSWIIDKVIQDKGGLHNRITREIHLEPFDLSQSKKFLVHRGIQLSHRQILLLFMLTGGVPYYLTKIEKGLSAIQIIEQLAFSKKAFFLDEFDKLFSSLFDNPDFHIAAIKAISENQYGIGERKLLEKMGPHWVGGTGKKVLKELEQSGFIMSFKPIFNKKRGTYYRLFDEYVAFYLRWIEPIRFSLERKALEQGSWQEMQSTPEWYSWLGYAFESVCYKHLSKIKKALKLSPSAESGTWRHIPNAKSADSDNNNRDNKNNRGAQIDLLFDRKDDAITLCEIKYSEEPFILTKEQVENLQRRVQIFKEKTGTQKQIFIAMICAGGLKNNYYAEDLISGIVSLEDFFDA